MLIVSIHAPARGATNDINLPNCSIRAVQGDTGTSKRHTHPYELSKITIWWGNRVNSAMYHIFRLKHVDGNQPWKPVDRMLLKQSIGGIDGLNRYGIHDKEGFIYA